MRLALRIPVLVLAACGAPAPSAQAPAPPAVVSATAAPAAVPPEPWRASPIEPGAFVVIEDASWVAPSADEVRGGDTSPPARLPYPRLLARVAQDRDQVVEVSFPDVISRDHCTTFGPLGPPTEATWFVPRRALVPLLARPLVHRWDDGTAVAVAPGLPLRRTHDGRGFELAYPDASERFTVPVTLEHVGLAYVPAPPPSLGVEHVGGPSFHSATIGGQKVRVSVRDDAAPGTIVGSRRTCGQLAVKLGDADPGMMGGLGESWSVIAAGTELTRLDGRPLGRLRADWNLPTHELAPKEGTSTMCLKTFTTKTDATPYTSLVCAPTAAIRRGEHPYPLGRILY